MVKKELEDCNSVVDFGEPVNEIPGLGWLTPSADLGYVAPFAGGVTVKEGVRREECVVRRSRLK